MTRLSIPIMVCSLSAWAMCDSIANGQVVIQRHTPQYEVRQNPYTGRSLPQRSYYNPYTGQHDHYRDHHHETRHNVREEIRDRIKDKIHDRIHDHNHDRHFNPLTGRPVIGTVTRDPYTGNVQRSGMVYNPLSGGYVAGRVEYNPLTGQHCTTTIRGHR